MCNLNTTNFLGSAVCKDVFLERNARKRQTLLGVRFVLLARFGAVRPSSYKL